MGLQPLWRWMVALLRPDDRDDGLEGCDTATRMLYRPRQTHDAHDAQRPEPANGNEPE